MLTLPIEKKWFDMILERIKLEEYREVKPYWRTRFAKALGMEKRLMPLEMILDIEQPLHLGLVKFRNGYGKKAPELVADCDLRIGTGKPEWGAAEGEEYYILDIKRLVSFNGAEEFGQLIHFPGKTVYHIVDQYTRYGPMVMATRIIDLTTKEIMGIDKDGKYWSTREKAEEEMEAMKKR